MSGVAVTCAGIAVCDVLARPVGQPLPIGFVRLVDEVHVAEGGSAVRTAGFLASMGINTRLVAAVGADLFGDHLKRSVRGDNLSVDWLYSEVSTSSSVILVGPGGERTILHSVGASAALTGDAIARRLTGDILHVGGAMVLPGLDGPDLVALFRMARSRAITTSLDVVDNGIGSWSWIASALPFTDLFCPSLSEAAALTGREDPGGAAHALRDLGVRLPIVTDGSNGCWVDSGGYRGHVPAFDVKTVDTTGAGDAFVAGAIIGLARGLAHQDLARLASACGALATTTVGTFAGPRSRDEPWLLAGLPVPIP